MRMIVRPEKENFVERNCKCLLSEGGENLERKLLETLYLRHYRELYVYVYAMCGQKALTEDILQETFLKAFTALKDSHTNMLAWLYLVARNLCFNAMKKEDRMEPMENPEQKQKNNWKSSGDPLGKIIGNEEKRSLWKALLSLDSPGKEILTLQYFSGFQQKEIAALLHLTPENVRVQSFRAKKKLRKLLEEQGDTLF